MTKAARNALSGYTYQQCVAVLLFAKMDTERNILKIESEAVTEDRTQFDDIYLELENNDKYRVQVKNYSNTTIEDIKVKENVVFIKGNKNEFNPLENNVLIVNTAEIKTDIEFMGMQATQKDGIVIIPLPINDLYSLLDDMYQDANRIEQIRRKADALVCSRIFTFTQDDLPEFITLSVGLQQKTILVRSVLSEIPKGILHIVGKPGVGKSHYVNELVKRFTDAIVYRFWIKAQDEKLSYRLNFDCFINELGLLIFKTPKSFTIQELVETIVKDELILIVDGLDHVRNYKDIDFDKYIDFINKVGGSNGRVLVLSRPIDRDLDWEQIELSNWSFDETQCYLVAAYNIDDYVVQSEIYELAAGYPIITFYLAEEFKKYGKIKFEDAIIDLNNYYSALMTDVKTKAVMSIFTCTNSFFTIQELEKFLDEFGFLVAKEFIGNYPYLFEFEGNRISLIHDSFNTYLRKNNIGGNSIENKVIECVKESLISGNVEYMARLSSFTLDNDFLIKLLMIYSDFNKLEKLLDSTLDFESITNFYLQLQQILEMSKNVLTYYQYYSFTLIFQIVTRNDLIGDDRLIYELLVYIRDNGNVEETIFSSGCVWDLYLFLKNPNKYKFESVDEDGFRKRQTYHLMRELESEINFFNIPNFDTEDIIKILNSIEIGSLEKAFELQKYLVSIWVNEERDKKFYNEFNTFIESNDIEVAVNAFKGFLVDEMYIRKAIHDAKSKLYDLGYFGEDNIFRKNCLMDIIKNIAPDGSFDVSSFVLSYIRLANKEGRKIDVFSINYLWSMYMQRKDYSVSTIVEALIFFENKGFINEFTSVDVISKLMNQSEKGIRHLLISYINMKGVEFTKRFIESGKSTEYNSDYDVFDLKPENIDCFSKSKIYGRTYSLLYYYRNGDTINFEEIKNAINSKYADIVLEELIVRGIKVRGKIGEVEKAKLQEWHIEFEEELEKIEEYVPFKNGYIHINDFDYISKNSLSIEECAKYTDGWYTCLPYIELFELFDKDELQVKCLDVLHTSIFARCASGNYIGNWHALIGHILLFYEVCNANIDWKVMFDIFKRFLKVSLIYFPEDNI